MSEASAGSEGGHREPAEDPLRRLEEQVADLTRRLNRIEQWLGISSAPPSGRRTAARPVPASETAPPPLVSSVPEAGREKPSFEPHPVSRSGVAIELEALLGGRVALWVGSLLVFIALAYFLALKWQAIPPWTRVTIGWVVGAFFMGTAEWFRERLSHWFVRGLSGAGIALFYLSTWAAFQRYSLVSFDTAAILMMATTAMCVYLSLRHDSPALLAFATIGGFLTPALLRSAAGDGGNQALPFLGYIALLNAGILVVSLSRRWHSVTFIAFAGTLILVPGWADTLILDEDLKALIFSFATIYFLEFLGAAVFYSVRHNSLIHEYDLALLLAASLAYAIAGQKLIQDRLGEMPSLFVVFLGLFYLGLFFIVRSVAPANSLLRNSSLGLALFFLAFAVPIQLRRPWGGIVWSLEALLLAAISRKPEHKFLPRASKILWIIALVATLIAMTHPESEVWRPLINSVALSLLAFAIASLGMGFLDLSLAGDRGTFSMSTIYLYCGVLAGAALIGYDAYQSVWTSRYPSVASYPLAAIAVIVIVLSAYTLGTFWVGLWYRVTAVQSAALLLLPILFALPLLASVAYRDYSWRPFLNLRFLGFAAVALINFVITRLTRIYRDRFSLPSARLHFWILLFTILFLFYSDLVRTEKFSMVILGFVFAAYMVILARQLRSPPLPAIAYLLVFFVIWVLLGESFSPLPPTWQAFAFLASFASLILLSAFAHRIAPSSSPGEPVLLSTGWVVGSILALWGLTQETYMTVYHYRHIFQDWKRAAELAISLEWTVSAGLLMALGFWRNLSLPRWAAFFLLGITLTKVFFYDLQFLPLAYRWLSLGALGIVLIVIAYLYARRPASISTH